MQSIKKTFVLATLLLFIALMGCEQNNPTDPVDETATGSESLDKAYGGYTTDDEQPGFGDTDMILEYDQSASVVSDTYSAETDSEMTDTAIPAYFVRLTWGHLQGDSTETQSTDWSGSFEINKGVMAVRKAIRFEQADYIHLPRTSRQLVAFTSFTKPQFDGVEPVIIDNDSSDAEGTLTINAGAYSRTFTFAELDSIESIETVDDLGNEFSIVAHVKEVQPFAGGFFEGRWMRRNAKGGKFAGRWINSLGTSVGFMKGIWGQNMRGQNVMFGKYIHRNGGFGGLLAGEWGSDDLNGESGWMQGRWVNRSRSAIGSYKGVWRTSLETDGKGFFHGRWNRKDGKPEGAESVN